MKFASKVFVVIIIISTLFCVSAMAENLESSNDVAFDKLKSYIVEKGRYDSSSGEYVIEISKEVMYSEPWEGTFLLKYVPKIEYILFESIEPKHKFVLWISSSEKTYFAIIFAGSKSLVTGVMERSSVQAYMNTNVPIATDEISQEYNLSDSEVQELANVALEVSFAETFLALEIIKAPVQLKDLGFVQLPGIETVANARESNSYNVVTVYAPDGRSEVIREEDLQLWKDVGWYEYPVTTVYALDGRSEIIPKEKFDAWINVGWYPYWHTITMYAPDGRRESANIADVAEWEKVGWFQGPVMKVYSIGDGGYTLVERTVKTSDLVAWKKVGWRDYLPKSRQESGYVKCESCGGAGYHLVPDLDAYDSVISTSKNKTYRSGTSSKMLMGAAIAATKREECYRCDGDGNYKATRTYYYY